MVVEMLGKVWWNDWDWPVVCRVTFVTFSKERCNDSLLSVKVSDKCLGTAEILSVEKKLLDPFKDHSTTGWMVSGPAALDGSRPASSFKIHTSEMLISCIYETLGLNVTRVFSFQKDGSVSKVKLGWKRTASESWWGLLYQCLICGLYLWENLRH